MTRIISVLETVRRMSPLVHNMTNTVVPEVTANALLAAGAAPAMIDLPEEAEVFAGLASGLLINVGNGSAEQHDGMRRAARAAQAAGTPWVLDPVAVGGLPVRTELARELLRFNPSAVRANASEILGLVGESGGGRGVDSTDEVESVLHAARRLAELSGVVAVSGPTDVVVSDGRTTRITGGDPMMTLVIGVNSFTTLSTPKPSIPGITRSVMTRSKGCCCRAARAASPPSTVVTSNPSTASSRLKDLRITSSSSTNKRE